MRTILRRILDHFRGRKHFTPPMPTQPGYRGDACPYCLYTEEYDFNRSGRSPSYRQSECPKHAGYPS